MSLPFKKSSERNEIAIGFDFLTVVVNNTAHVRHAAVAYFHVVLVNNGVEIVVWWEEFLD